MANGNIITNLGKKIIINRTFKSSPDYLPLSKFSTGIQNSTPSVASTDLDYKIPISNGTAIDGGNNLLTGSGGGNNSSDNTSVTKEGCGLSDGKSQNLLTNGTSATKTWTLTPLTANFSLTEPFAFWLYINTAATYLKFIAAGTALQLRIRTSGDAANKYYYYDRTKAQLAVGWNWITSNTTTVNGLSTGAGGAPSGALNEFIIEITTTAAGDLFAAGDVCYDLMRRWATTDLTKTYVTSYPTLDETNFEAEIRAQILSTEANGFNINGYADFNTDATNKMGTESTITAESKSSTDQFTFISKLRLV